MAARPAAVLVETGEAPPLPDHRPRLLEAAATVVSRRGYAATTTAEVAAAAGLSVADFDRHFGGREECFLAAYDRAAGRVEAAVRAELAGWCGGWAAGVRRAVTATAELLAADPRIGRLCGVEALFAGPRPMMRRRATVDRLAPALAAGRRERPAGAAELPADLERSLLGGAMLALGRATRPRELAPDLTYQLLSPYLGPAAARQLAAGA